eukprot:TRINITY_DN1994_c0_g1_i14.p1 TRINITY_DN1994_c0_g1~~TRINITY_DN1994_c0_g1_i14.p1  ORF type:complete len:115 (-),score=15.96 TRINITY_DN1994_c0_g1_i14:414-758(-)
MVATQCCSWLIPLMCVARKLQGLRQLQNERMFLARHELHILLDEYLALRVSALLCAMLLCCFLACAHVVASLRVLTLLLLCCFVAVLCLDVVALMCVGLLLWCAACSSSCGWPL